MFDNWFLLTFLKHVTRFSRLLVLKTNASNVAHGCLVNFYRYSYVHPLFPIDESSDFFCVNKFFQTVILNRWQIFNFTLTVRYTESRPKWKFRISLHRFWTDWTLGIDNDRIQKKWNSFEIFRLRSVVIKNRRIKNIAKYTQYFTMGVNIVDNFAEYRSQ